MYFCHAYGKVLRGFALAIGLFVCSMTAHAQTRYYVNGVVAASGAGTSWATAFKTLQEAIDATSTTVVDEIWVAQGTYFPNKNPFGTRFTPPSYSRQMTFYLNRPIRLYGGFNGTEATLGERNITANITRLSANINDPDDSTDNVYHVILALGTPSNPIGNDLVIDGFTITGGCANFSGAITVNTMAVYNYNGGGIYNIYASPTLSNLTIHKNVAFVGGGIHNNNSSPVLNNVNITYNSASASGGGIYNNDGAPVLNNVNISYNKTDNEGGGMNNLGASPVLNNVAITNNRAFQGGGIYNSGDSISMANVMIDANSATTDGGGMYSFTDTYVELNNVQITNNTAQYGGGIRSFRASLDFNGGSMSNNTAAYYGGGAFVAACSINMVGTTIAGNKATTYQAGGMFIDEESVLYFSNLTIGGNSAKTDAGGLLFKANSIASFQDVTFSSNTSLRYGGGIYFSAGQAPGMNSTLSNVTFSQNQAFGGGGVYINTSSPAFTNVTFTGNVSTDAGGGMLNTLGAYPVLQQVYFTGNKAVNGGGMFNQNGSLPVINNVHFKSNEATTNGGGVYNACNAHFTAVVISGNKAKNGGGMYNSSAPVMTNVLWSGNLASERGGGLYVQTSAPVLTNATFAGNNALLGGGGIYANGSGNLKIRNSIVYGNSSGLGFVNGLPDIFYSLIEGRTDITNGNLLGTTDPLFTNAPGFATAPFSGGHYALQASSPLVNKGDHSFFAPGAVPDLSHITTDLSGRMRLYNGQVDMGGYEYQPGTLPLRMISFKAEKEQRYHILLWQTAEEEGVDFFQVEQSLDGRTFQSIGKLAAKGSGNYRFTQQTPPPNSIVYYRLRIQDKDGSQAYSSIVSISGKEQRDRLLVYPNPASDRVTVTDTQGRQVSSSIQLINNQGTVVLQASVKTFDVSGLPEGIYILRTIGKDGRPETGKLVIKR